MNDELDKAVTKLERNIERLSDRMDKRFAEMTDLLREKYPTRDELVARMEQLRTEHKPVKNLVFGLVGLILTAVVGALITLVLR